MGRGQRRERPSKAILPPEYYKKRLEAFTRDGRVKAIHADSTMISIDRMERTWQRYCLYTDRDPRITLEACSTEIFENFLHWILNNSRVKKRSSLETYWKYFNILYTRQTGRPVDKATAKTIQEYVRSITD
jgi:hypothetical protein